MVCDGGVLQGSEIHVGVIPVLEGGWGDVFHVDVHSEDERSRDIEES